MLDSGVVGVVIGLILIYFLLSLLCSGLNELMEAILRRRAKFLEAGVVDLLGRDLKRQLYDHPLLETLYPQKGIPQGDEGVPKADRRKPSYIPPKVFSQALLTIVTEGSARLTEEVDAGTDRLPVDASTGFAEGFVVQIHEERMEITKVEPAQPPVDRGARGTEVESSWLTVARGVEGTTPAKHAAGSRITRFRVDIPSAQNLAVELRRSVDRLPSGRLREVLGGILTRTGSDLDRWREGTEAWFDDKMDRVSGWYGRRTRWWLFVYGILIVLVLNADSALVARTLWGDATLRDAIVAQAGVVVASGGTNEPCEDPACVAERLEQVKALDLPLGWPDLRLGDWGGDAYRDEVRVPHNAADVALKIFGLVATAAALTLGAPFWFDLLNKITNFRVSGPPPARSTPSTS
jgi:hypothetical protein